MLTTRLVDLTLQAGADLGCTDWLTIDQGRIDSFAELTEVRQWIHADPARAAVRPFGTTNAHGYLTLSLVSGLLLDLLVVSDAGLCVNYGLNRVRFPSPVPSGSRVRGFAQLIDVQRLEGGGAQTTTRASIHKADDRTPVVVADILARFLP